MVEGSVNVMGRKGGNRLFPTLTLTLTFHHPEQSLLHKLHWLDHVIRVGVFSVSARATTNTLPPLYRQINREDRLVVREGVCVLGSAREHKHRPVTLT